MTPDQTTSEDGHDVVKLSAPLLVPLDVRCPRCDAMPGQRCRWIMRGEVTDRERREVHTLRQWHARREASRMAERRAQGRRR